MTGAPVQTLHSIQKCCRPSLEIPEALKSLDWLFHIAACANLPFRLSAQGLLHGGLLYRLFPFGFDSKPLHNLILTLVACACHGVTEHGRAVLINQVIALNLAAASVATCSHPHMRIGMSVEILRTCNDKPPGPPCHWACNHDVDGIGICFGQTL